MLRAVFVDVDKFQNISHFMGTKEIKMHVQLLQDFIAMSFKEVILHIFNKVKQNNWIWYNDIFLITRHRIAGMLCFMIVADANHNHACL